MAKRVIVRRHIRRIPSRTTIRRRVRITRIIRCK